MRVNWIRGEETIDFIRPNTFFTLGVRGSGKSTLLETIGNLYRGKGHAILDLFGCYSDDTELFTTEGFKLFKDVTKEDLVATRDDHGFMSFRNPTAIQVYPYKGKMIQIGKPQSSYNLLVTPVHNLYVKKGNNPRAKFIQPTDLQNYIQTHRSHHTPFKIPKTAIWDAIERPYIKLPKPADLDEWKTKIVEYVPVKGFLKVLGWYLSDGNTHLTNGGSRVEITKPNREKQAEIVAAFLEMGYKAKVYRDKVYVENKQLYDYFKPLGHAHEKYIPKEIKQLPPHRLGILIKTMLKGDGSRDLIYYTSSKRLWDDLVEISIKAGYSVTTYQRPPRIAKMKDGRIIKGNYPEYSVTISHRDEPSIHRDAVWEVDYDGYVYDVTLPPHHTLLVRRKGKITWSGNSRDGEGLAWLRAPDVDPEKVLLIHGDNVDVTAPVDNIAVSDLRLKDFEKYKILISSSPLYSSPDQEFREVNTITALLYRRMSWKSLIYVLVREASNLYYSRLKIMESQSAAKADMIYLIREARHMGVALGLDTLKFTSIDSDIRATIDYLFFKSQGVQGLPDDLGWMYGFIDPHVMRRMKPGEFVLLTRSGSLGVGVFPPIKWHKDEGEHILAQLGISCEYGEELEYGKDRGVYSTLGDKDHADLIAAYMEGGEGMGKIAKAKGLSSGTVWAHINDHNREVEKAKECDKCRRVGGAYMNTLIVRRRKMIIGGAGS